MRTKSPRPTSNTATWDGPASWIAPLVRPLGWDWRIGCAVIASFPAREVVIGTLGVIYQLGSDQDVASPSLRETLRTATWPGSQRRVFNVPVALSIMVFFALCAECAATLAVIRRETNSWRWPVFTFVYMTALAYLGGLITYQVGMLFGDAEGNRTWICSNYDVGVVLAAIGYLARRIWLRLSGRGTGSAARALVVPSPRTGNRRPRGRWCRLRL